MTISSSLNAGVMGLTANATRLSTISDNIANSATYGYKRSQVNFSSLVIDQSTSAYSAGGVRVDAFKDNSTAGSLISTGSATDIAIAGRGLFPVTTAAGLNTPAAQRPLQLLPTGSFLPDADGNLRNESGLFLLGWPADGTGQVTGVDRNSGTNLEPVNITSSQLVAAPTTSMALGINLPADATNAGAPTDPYQLPIEYFDNIGRSNTLTFSFSAVVPANGTSHQWQVSVFDTAGDPNTAIGTFDLQFDDGGGGNGNGGRLTSLTPTSGVTFDATTGIMSIVLPHDTVEVDIGIPGQAGGISQFSSPFTQNIINKNGGPVGELESVEFDAQGRLSAIYATGHRQVIYQIPVADVPNMNGLTAKDGQALALSQDSGALYFFDAGTGPVGALAGRALMESTTDIASELTDLIETQRAYTSNAKIVQTVDEMLQETTNLKR